jgi:hypothetical protein
MSDYLPDCLAVCLSAQACKGLHRAHTCDRRSRAPRRPPSTTDRAAPPAGSATAASGRGNRRPYGEVEDDRAEGRAGGGGGGESDGSPDDGDGLGDEEEEEEEEEEEDSEWRAVRARVLSQHALAS